MNNASKKSMVVAGGLASKVKIAATLAIVTILVLSFMAFFIYQAENEREIRRAIFEQQKERQVIYAKSVANNIRSDFELLMNKLETIALSKPIQDHLVAGEAANSYLKQFYDQASAQAKINGVSLIDQNDKVVSAYVGLSDFPNLVGLDASKFPTTAETKNNLPNPTFSTAFKSPIDGGLRIALSYPVYNYETSEYMGSINVVVDAHSFLSKYGNLDDAGSQYIGFLDRDWTVISSPFKEIEGRNFNDPIAAHGSNEQIKAHFAKVLSGQPSVALFSYRTGDRLNAGEPIVLGGKPTYFVFIVTPADAIYAQIDAVIASQRTSFYLLQGAIAGAIVISLFLLLKWSGNLEKAVKERTRELQASSAKLVATTEELQEANLQLKAREQMQKEFIDTAAHELRTPIVPILMMTEDVQIQGDEITMTKDDFDMVVRNAKRLRTLVEDMLDVTRIENGTLAIDKKHLNLSDHVLMLVDETRRNLKDTKKGGIKVISEIDKDIELDVDKERISQVVLNLVSNAIKFTDNDGTIVISCKKSQDGSSVFISVKDTGRGIDPVILPNLFKKFTTKSEKGVGLGLFISKNLVEAHGGKIWAENTKGRNGATFTFTLPLRGQ